MVRLASALLLAVSVLMAQEPVPEAPDTPPDPVATQKAADRARIQHLPNGDVQVGKLLLHRKERCISFPVEFVEQVSVLEVIIATPEGRLHESLLKADVSPLQLQAMLYLLDLSNGPRLDTETLRQGDLVDLDIEWTDANGARQREPIESWIIDGRTKAPMKREGWVFVGSGMRNGEFLADSEGNICINYSVGSTILDIPDPAGADDTIFTVNKDKPFPPATGNVRVVLSPRAKDKAKE